MITGEKKIAASQMPDQHDCPLDGCRVLATRKLEVCLGALPTRRQTAYFRKGSYDSTGNDPSRDRTYLAETLL